MVSAIVQQPYACVPLPRHLFLVQKHGSYMYTHTGGGARPRKLSNAMSAALLNFMRTGNPNGGTLLPNWPKYTAEKGETMVLNDTSKAENPVDGPVVNFFRDKRRSFIE